MKKIVLFAVACFVSVLLFGQNAPIDKYGVGQVPIDNKGKVTFIKDFSLQGKDVENCYKSINSWARSRFAKQDVKKSSITNIDSTHFSMRIQQTIEFTRTFITLDYTKINYILDINLSEGNLCRIKMTDINYIYEDEREGGGSRFTAEEWITDDEAFNKNKTKLLKTTGKFRIKTIDLFYEICSDVSDILN
jgi:hypothetical protein